TIGRVDGNEDQSRLCGGELRQRPFGAVQRPDADPRATFQTEREEACGQRIDAGGELRPGPADIVTWRHQCFTVRPAGYREIEALPDGCTEQRRIGDTANVTTRSIAHG